VKAETMKFVSTQYATFISKRKDWLARNQVNVEKYLGSVS
jgi:hypothetical protein